MAIDLIENSELQPLAPSRGQTLNATGVQGLSQLQARAMERELSFLGIGDSGEEDRIREAQERARKDFPLPKDCEECDRTIAACVASIEGNRRTLAAGCDNSCQRVNNREIAAKELQLAELKKWRANAGCDAVLAQKEQVEFLTTSTALLNQEEYSARAAQGKRDWMIYAAGALIVVGLSFVVVRKLRS